MQFFFIRGNVKILKITGWICGKFLIILYKCIYGHTKQDFINNFYKNNTKTIGLTNLEVIKSLVVDTRSAFVFGRILMHKSNQMMNCSRLIAHYHKKKRDYKFEKEEVLLSLSQIVLIKKKFMHFDWQFNRKKA